MWSSWVFIFLNLIYDAYLYVSAGHTCEGQIFHPEGDTHQAIGFAMPVDLGPIFTRQLSN